MGSFTGATDHDQILWDRLVTENLRPLYDGIVDLRRLILQEYPVKEAARRSEGDHTERDIKVKQSELFGGATLEAEVRDKVAGWISSAYNAKHQLLWQSPIFSLCEFWEALYKKPLYDSSGLDQGAVTTITRMLLLYDLLQRLSEMNTAQKDLRYHNDDLPYCFENICEYIRKITECRNAYIIHQVGCGDTQIVCRSAYLAEELEEKANRSSACGSMNKAGTAGDTRRFVSAEDFSFLLRKTDKEGVHIITDQDCQESDSSESCPRSLEGDNHVVILLTRVGDRRGEKLYLVLQTLAWDELAAFTGKDDVETKRERSVCVVKKVSRVLFLRKHLVEAIERHFERLLNNRYECGFVKFVPKWTIGARLDREYPNILHLTDLHADDRFEVIEAEALHRFKEALSKQGPVDLLMISGDIADAKGGSAVRVQENYHYAEVFLTKLVIQLWGKEDSGSPNEIRVPFDWRRRVLFVPGNHDFASMNLLQIVQQRRRLAAGLPTDGVNGIVAKFSYYLDFLLRFLDAPIDMFIRNSINEVREYRRMNTKVFMMNSSFGSSAARTNKVSLDRDTVMRLSQESAWKECDHMDVPYRVVVVHHPYTWPIDYLLDGYSNLGNELWDWDWKKKTAFVKRDNNIKWQKIVDQAYVKSLFSPSDEVSVPESKHLNDLYFAFGEAIYQVFPIYEESRYARDGDGEKALRELVKEKLKDSSQADLMTIFLAIYDRKKDQVKNLSILGHHTKKHFFTKDAATFRAILDKHICDISEEDEQLMHRLFQDLQRAKDDEREFGSEIDAISQTATVLLCGHEHAEDYPKVIEPSAKPWERVVVGDKFVTFNENKSNKAYGIKKLSALYITACVPVGEEEAVKLHITSLFSKPKSGHKKRKHMPYKIRKLAPSRRKDR